MPLTFLRNLGIVSAAGITTTKLGAGAVLQVVTSSTNTQQTTTSSTFVDATGLSVSITPSSASNKIFVICTTAGASGNSVATSDYTLLRGVTNLATNLFNRIFGTDSTGQISMAILDSPNTTSATTYKAQFRRSSASGTAYIQDANSFGQITAFEIKG
jgi:hypothetical protein